MAGKLSPMQKRILDLVLDLRTNREIAAATGWRLQSVKNTLTVLYAQFKVSNRIELIRILLKSDQSTLTL